MINFNHCFLLINKKQQFESKIVKIVILFFKKSSLLKNIELGTLTPLKTLPAVPMYNSKHC